MTPMEINYSGKSALIVDSKLEDLGTLRQILSRIGVGTDSGSFVGEYGA